MYWNEDALEYGYVVTKLPTGEWWHMHFGRIATEYTCELLGIRTNVVTVIRAFAAGGVARSPQFVITLDGEILDEPIADLNINFDWGGKDSNEKLRAHAKLLQTNVVPLLYENSHYHEVVSNIIRNY